MAITLVIQEGEARESESVQGDKEEVKETR